MGNLRLPSGGYNRNPDAPPAELAQPSAMLAVNDITVMPEQSMTGLCLAVLNISKQQLSVEASIGCMTH